MKNRFSLGVLIIAMLALLGASPTYDSLILQGASSGSATLTAPSAAGTPTLTLPTATGTVATRTGSVTTDHCAKFDSSGRIIDAGGACGTFAAPDRTVTSCGSCTVLAADMGGQINYNGSSLTAVIPAISSTVLAAGMQVVLTNQHSSALTISTTPTLNGYSGSTIPQYGGLACTSNGTSLDCLALGTAGGSGTVTTTGSPANGELTKFSGSTSVTTGNLSGDATTSGSLVVTVGKVNGVTYGASPSTNTVPVITSSNTVTYEAVPNAALANAATTVNGQTCTLGSSCTITASAGTVTVGTTAIASGTNGRLLFDSSAVLGESAGLSFDGTSVLSLGVAGASVGGVALKNATSGTVTISPVSGALGTVTLSAPARTATLATTTGSLTSGDCAQFDVSGNLTAAGAACSGGSGDVVGPGSSTAGHFAIFDGTTGKLLKDTLAAPGTAAVVNTGTSGATIPLNNANNTISGNNTYSGTSTYTGSIIVPIRSVTAAGAITVSATTDYMICVNKTVGAATTVNLPGSPATGLTFLIKDCKADAATNNITVTPASGNIDGAGTYVISTNRGAVAVVYSGSEWTIN